ncbi:MAG TPA: hypothetical protein VMF89_37285 [Polyangiales bacterium]|nr:hypothetical protein [Polyangiales bacterium]
MPARLDATSRSSDGCGNRRCRGTEQQPFALAKPEEPPQRYGIQFEAAEEYVRLLDEAQALLSHAAPNLSLSDLHLRALRSFVAELKRKQCAAVDEPRSVPAPRQRGRHIAASVRRAVYQRDQARCFASSFWLGPALSGAFEAHQNFPHRLVGHARRREVPDPTKFRGVV